MKGTVHQHARTLSNITMYQKKRCNQIIRWCNQLRKLVTTVQPDGNMSVWAQQRYNVDIQSHIKQVQSSK